MKLRFLFILLILKALNSYSQELPEIRLNIFVSGNLSSALKQIATKYKLNISYDTNRCEQIKLKPQRIDRPLKYFLNSTCEQNKLKYYITTNGTIHVVDRWYNPQDEIAKEIKSFSGNPSKFNIAVSGKVVDKESRESLPFISIVVKGSNTGSASNVDGFFTLLKVPTDTSTLVVSYIGYKKREVFLTPSVNTQNLLIELEPEVHGIEEVVISADKQDILHVNGLQASVIKMSPKKLNTLPNLGEKDILRSFQLMPGISAANENSSGLYIRGGTPDQVLVQYDGFTVYNIEHMFGFFSAFNSNAIKDVQLYKGGFDAKYGGRLSGVVEITGKEGNQKEFNGAIDLSLMSVNGFVEFPIGQKVSAVIAARRSWKSPLYNKIFDQFTDENAAQPPIGRAGSAKGGNVTQETNSYFYDINSKITYRPTDKDIIALSIYNGKDDLDNSIQPPSRTSRFGGATISADIIDLTNWGNTGMSLKWSRQISNRLYLNSLLSYSNYYSLRERSTTRSSSSTESTILSSNGLSEDNNLNDITGKVDFEYKLSQSNQLFFGLQTTYNNVDYTYIQNDTTTVINRESEGLVYTAYVQDRISLFAGKMNITPGLRYNYFTETGENYFEPRLNVMYNLNERFKLKGAAGNYYQFAKRVIREDISQGSRDFWVLSDDDNLPVSSSVQYIAGLSYETPKYLFDVEGFYKNLSSVTEYSLRINASKAGVDFSENFFTGSGIAKGIDFLAQKKQGKFTGWLGYTLSQVTNNIPEFGDYDYYALHDVTHEFKAVGTYRWRNWDLGATWIYASGKPYSSPEGGYQITLLDGTVADYINVSVKNGNRLPDYHRLDLSASYNFTFGKQSPASIGFSVFNVYNRANVWYNEYEIIENEILESPVHYLGITPNISLSIRFK